MSVLLHFDDKQQHILSLGQSFANLESLVEMFGAAQTIQVNMQSRLYEQIDQMQNNMYVARGLLADVTSSASNLQVTIEDTSMRMAQMTTFSDITENVFRWSWLLLLVFLIHQLRPRYNTLATSALGRSSFPWQKYFNFMGAAQFSLSLSKKSLGYCLSATMPTSTWY